tara:strand:+ start:1233 stop:1802 length:570 start_codon:yes stop_codon:yes gene_type:complete
MSKKIILILSLLVIGVLCRMIPHPPNVTPIIAIALLASHAFKNKWIAILIPLAGMWISDLMINNYLYAGYYDKFIFFSSGSLWIYGSIIFISLIGKALIKHIKLSTVFLSSLSASFFFFIITNFGVWFSSMMYSKSLLGLIECYTLAIPFFRNALIGDLFYCAVLFTSYSLVFSNRFELNKVGNTKINQ